MAHILHYDLIMINKLGGLEILPYMELSNISHFLSTWLWDMKMWECDRTVALQKKKKKQVMADKRKVCQKKWPWIGRSVLNPQRHNLQGHNVTHFLSGLHSYHCNFMFVLCALNLFFFSLIIQGFLWWPVM